MWRVDWWNKEYVSRFPHFKRNDPYYDLEVYMNWEPNSWNDRKFIVSQGDGLFKHVYVMIYNLIGRAYSWTLFIAGIVVTLASYS